MTHTTHEKQLVSIGRISKIFGHSGQLKITLNADLLKIPRIRGTIYLKIQQKPVPYFLKEINWLDDRTAVVRLFDINDNTQALSLLGYEILYPAAQKSQSGRNLTSVSDLMGFDVFDQSGKMLGSIKSITTSGGQVLLNIDRHNGELLVPFHENLLLAVDPGNHSITLEIAEGLEEL